SYIGSVPVVASVPADDGTACRLTSVTSEALDGALPVVAHESHTGIAHTRWATHGRPAKTNAHPHRSGQRLAIVHNGIIENFTALREELQTAGFQFTSDTDTEVVAHLIAREMDQQRDFVTAFSRATARLEGAYAIAAISPAEPEALYLVRMGSPLVIGVSTEENY